MITLLSLVLRLAFIGGFALVFVTLLEHGAAGFSDGITKEWSHFTAFAKDVAEGKALPAAQSGQPSNSDPAAGTTFNPAPATDGSLPTAVESIQTNREVLDSAAGGETPAASPATNP